MLSNPPDNPSSTVAVAVTASHLERPPLGWTPCAVLVDGAASPVFALGGMQPELARAARQHGGQGVAVLHGLWNPAGG
ncbi:MAG TPA: thiamine phosphate synthase [Immundisolibacter sp.]